MFIQPEQSDLRAMEGLGLSDEAVSAACKEGAPITKVTTFYCVYFIFFNMFYFPALIIAIDLLCSEAVMQSDLLAPSRLWPLRAADPFRPD